MDYAANRPERPHVSVTEVGTRDGFQSEPELILAAVKAEVIDGLIDAGIRHVEATSFVSPRAVPQLDPSRRINEQDCSKPIDWSAGNLRCK